MSIRLVWRSKSSQLSMTNHSRLNKVWHSVLQQKMNISRKSKTTMCKATPLSVGVLLSIQKSNSNKFEVGVLKREQFLSQVHPALSKTAQLAFVTSKLRVKYKNKLQCLSEKTYLKLFLSEQAPAARHLCCFVSLRTSSQKHICARLGLTSK